jgi:nicotinate phosphoribosyltransferase
MQSAASPLLTDLYQLNMIQAYLEHGETKPAVFEFFVRKLPRERGFLIAAGLEQALDLLENLRFSSEELEWLARTGRFGNGLLDHLAQLRFTGDVHAMPEGTVFFANEPILRVTARCQRAAHRDALSTSHFQSLIAAKAARMVLCARQAALSISACAAHTAPKPALCRARSYTAGFAAPPPCWPASLFGILIYGTTAIRSCRPRQRGGGIRALPHSRPENLVLLIDTYDTEEAARGSSPCAAP